MQNAIKVGPVDYHQVIGALDSILEETRVLMARFEAAGLDERLPADYSNLHEIYQKTVKAQWGYVQAMLELEGWKAERL